MAVRQKPVLLRRTQVPAAHVADGEGERSADALLVGGRSVCRRW